MLIKDLLVSSKKNDPLLSWDCRVHRLIRELYSRVMTAPSPACVPPRIRYTGAIRLNVLSVVSAWAYVLFVNNTSRFRKPAAPEINYCVV